jgi:hypothetical protein
VVSLSCRSLAGFVAWPISASEAGSSVKGEVVTVPLHCAAAPEDGSQEAVGEADGMAETPGEVLDAMVFDEKEE